MIVTILLTNDSHYIASCLLVLIAIRSSPVARWVVSLVHEQQNSEPSHQQIRHQATLGQSKKTITSSVTYNMIQTIQLASKWLSRQYT